MWISLLLVETIFSVEDLLYANLVKFQAIELKVIIGTLPS